MKIIENAFIIKNDYSSITILKMKIPTFEKSCASNPELVKIWSIENELKPEQVYLKSGKKIKWSCLKCNHIYEQTPGHKFIGRKCPYCSIPCKKLCGNINCNFCLLKSCASVTELIISWNEVNLKPINVFLGHETKLSWKCHICRHIFHQSPNNRTNRKSGCPFCSNSILCKEENCEICFNKSCASNINMINLWNSKSNPRHIFK
jgi:rubrerythrin